MARKIVIYVAVLLSFVFLFYSINLNITQVLEGIGSISVSNLLLPILLGFAALFIQIKAWHFSYAENKAKISMFDASHLFCVSALTAYIPSKIPGLVITAEMAKALGVSRRKTMISVILYQLMSLIACAILIIIFVLLAAETIIDDWVAYLVVITIILLYVIIIRFNFIAACVNHLAKKFEKAKGNKINGTVYKISTAKYLKLTAYLMLSWLLVSIMLTLLIGAAGGAVSFQNLYQVGAVFLLSYIAGNLAFFVPSGIGVFEATLYLSLSKLIAEIEALTITALARLLMVLPVVVLYSLIKYMSHKRSE